MSGITTHVLDVSIGRPARGVPVQLEFFARDRGWIELARQVTDDDGRARGLTAPDQPLEAGPYRLTFGSGEYFRARGGSGFYPEVSIVFEVREPADHYHVPLLLSPFGYSTYRGS